MKTIYSIILTLALATVSLAGTIDFKPDVQTSKDIVIKFKEKTNTFVFTHDSYLKKAEYEKQYNKYMAETLYTISQYGKQNGFSHFAIVNTKMNNLAGYPINSYQGLVQYGRLAEQIKFKEDFSPDIFGDNEFETIIANNQIEIRVIYLKEATEGLFLYNIDETITDTKKAL